MYGKHTNKGYCLNNAPFACCYYMVPFFSLSKCVVLLNLILNFFRIFNFSPLRCMTCNISEFHCFWCRHIFAVARAT